MTQNSVQQYMLYTKCLREVLPIGPISGFGCGEVMVKVLVVVPVNLQPPAVIAMRRIKDVLQTCW
ncbi:hypothetical protein AYR66_18470 [Noviherbaspirillum denitrificans]|uniref:Uncharacterized protein n=1 Tax=Noviherbaspirillum denitrificans TaxID=1968433 RepID=A0A254TF52_9BURK|nr:hypothetical protein AYR66_18470 [Noviherbaspirillum denitrificans]